MTGQPVVVVGLMGAGKTTVGRRLARALARPFWDSDEKLQARYGANAAAQAARYGADVLHQREATMLREALASRPPPVVAAAASVVDDPACRARLADDAYVVWLDAPPRVLARRVSQGDHRPRYDRDPEVMLARQYQQRAARFREVADLAIDVSRRTPAEIVTVVRARLTDGLSDE